MKRRQSLMLFLIMLFAIPIATHAQAWSGIIAPNRAIDWTQAGIPGGIPSGSWTQCGSTIAAYTGTAATINTVLAGCGANQYVLLGPGTFTLSTAIAFNGKSNLALRGSGANSTFLSFPSAVSGAGCNTPGSILIGVCGPTLYIPSSPPPNIYTWSAGYAQGANQITLSSTANITIVGAGSPTLLLLNQCDDGYTGYPCSGSSVDNGNYFVCADAYSAGPPATGCSSNGPDGAPGAPLNNRWQYELVVATAINGKVVTISPPLRHPNWRSGQSPKVWLQPTFQRAGVENLSIDANTPTSTTSQVITLAGCYQCWVSGVRVTNFPTWGIQVFAGVHDQIQNNYLFNGGNAPGSDPYGIRFSFFNADNLIQNNIIQAVRTPTAFDGVDEGSVIAYNFTINDRLPPLCCSQSVLGDAMFGALWDHATGDDFHLREGNIGSQLAIDEIHGTHLNETSFRNFMTGWESCANGQCGVATIKDFGASAVAYGGGNRYGHIIGGVYGTPGFTSSYLTTTQGASNYVYNVGFHPGSIPVDPLVKSTTLFWANWDNVTNATRFCGNSSDTGWSTTCTGTSEVPTGAPVYPNSIPTLGDTGIGQGPLPASFFLSSKPAWFGSLPWPSIGPDVTGGNVGQCAGTLNTPGQYAGVPATSSSQCTGSSLNTAAWGGHVNANPAMNCYLNVMGGAPDGTGSVLPFNAASCYGGVTGPAPPANLSVVVQ